MSSFPRRYRRNLGHPNPSVTMDPPPTITTTTTLPLSSSSSPQGVIFSGGVSPPLIAGFISIGAFAVAVISICAWCRYVGRHNVVQEEEEQQEDSVFLRILPARFRRGRRQGQGQGQGGAYRRGRRGWREGREGVDRELKVKPEMYHVWISGERIADTLKWETESDSLVSFLKVSFSRAAFHPPPPPWLVNIIINLIASLCDTFHASG